MGAQSALQRAADGTWVSSESRRVLRWFLFVGALVLTAIVGAAFMSAAGSGWKGLLGGLVGAAAMVLLACALSDLRIVIDVANEQLTWERRSVFSRQRVVVPFADVRDVFVLEAANRESEDRVGGYSVTYRPMLRTASQTLPLSMSEGSDSSDARALCDAVLARLAGHAAASPERSQLEQTLLAGRLIDAVAMVRAERGVSLTEARRLVDEMKGKLSRPG